LTEARRARSGYHAPGFDSFGHYYAPQERWLRGGEVRGALQVAYAHDSRILDLTIENAGGQGIKEAWKSESVGLTIEGCHIRNTGACGIKVNGIGMIIQNNHIHDIGVLYPSAIALNCGGGKAKPNDSIIAHNEIHDVPYTGIACGGMNSRIESNLIYRAMQQLNDGAGIYITFCANITVRGNFVHDLSPASSGHKAWAYYLDEKAANCLVEGNLSLNAAFPFLNHMASANTLRNNVFLHKGDMLLAFSESAGDVMEANIVQASGSISVKGFPDGSTMSHNVFYSQRGVVTGVTTGNSVKSPGIRSDDHGKITFAQGSEAERLGSGPST